MGRKTTFTNHQMRDVREGVLSDATMKEIAFATGIAHQTICRLAARCGFRRMYVTDEERATVMTMRKGKVAA